MDSMPIELLQLGGTGAALLVFYLLMKPTLKNLHDSVERKDRQMVETAQAFTKTINNHMDHDIKSRNELTSTLGRLNESIDQLPQKTIILAKKIYPVPKRKRKNNAER